MTSPSSPDMREKARALIEEALTEQFGEKCPDYAEGCYACAAWAEYERLVAGSACEHFCAVELRHSEAGEGA